MIGIASSVSKGKKKKKKKRPFKELRVIMLLKLRMEGDPKNKITFKLYF